MSAIDSADELYGLLARAGTSRRRRAGSVIFERGENGTSMYILTGGTIAHKRDDDVVFTVEAPRALRRDGADRL